MSVRRDFNRLKGEASRRVAIGFGVDLIGGDELRARLRGMDEKVAAKIVQNAIKPVVRMGRAEWKKGIRSAKVSGRSNTFRRRYGRGLRSALAQSVKAKTPSGAGKNVLRAYISLGGRSAKKGQQAITNAGQAMWLEYGTKPHSLGRGRKHPGTSPMTNVRERIDRLRPVARRLFEEAVIEGMSTGGQTIKAPRLKVLKSRAELLA